MGFSRQPFAIHAAALALASAALGCTPVRNEARDAGAIDGGAIDGGAIDGGVASGPRLFFSQCVLPGAPDAGLSCTPIDEPHVVFGDVIVGQCRTAVLYVQNRGDAELLVDAPALDPNSSPDIAFVGDPPGGFTLAPSDGGAYATRSFQLMYCAGEEQHAYGWLALTSNDPTTPDIEVLLDGFAFIDPPPVCVCNPSSFEVAPGDTVTLQARCGTSGISYDWTFVSKPSGSRAVLSPRSGGEATFVADVATDSMHPYVVRVTRTNGYGAAGTCTYTVFATPRATLHVQLVWDAPQADLDLHFLNATGLADLWGDGGWFTTPNDCHFANRRPDWGRVGFVGDDPAFAMDATNGGHPEDVTYGVPVPGTYAIGVHDFCDPMVDGGVSSATLRIFCNGALTNELGPRVMSPSGSFWHVANVRFPGCEITQVDSMRATGRGCGLDGGL